MCGLFGALVLPFSSLCPPSPFNIVVTLAFLRWQNGCNSFLSHTTLCRRRGRGRVVHSSSKKSSCLAEAERIAEDGLHPPNGRAVAQWEKDGFAKGKALTRAGKGE